MTNNENDDEEHYPSYGEQAAFSEANSIMEQLQEDPNCSLIEIGQGFLVAAMVALRKGGCSYEEMAKRFYEAADDYACRKEKE